MAKKALISLNETRGQDLRGYRVVDVVDSGNEYETHPSLEWKDCSDTIEPDKYWYDPTTTSYRVTPDYVSRDPAGQLAQDDEGAYLEEYEFDWTTDTWTKQVL